MTCRAALRAWLLLCALTATAACEGTETGNPDLATGGVGAHPSIGEGGSGGFARADGGLAVDGGSSPDSDAGTHSGSDAGPGPSQDGGAADDDGGFPDEPDDGDAGR